MKNDTQFRLKEFSAQIDDDIDSSMIEKNSANISNSSNSFSILVK